MSKIRESIIKNYIIAYNEFDVEKMVQKFDDKIVFKNIQTGEVSMTIAGIDDFKKQAESVKKYFEKRQQKIISIKHIDQKTEIEIDYFGILAIDFPNGLKKGEKIELKGKSIFTFHDDKIIELTDIS